MRYKDTIANLTLEQKIAIVSDACCLSEIKIADKFTPLKMGRVDRLSEKEAVFPNYSALPYTWNSDLNKRVFSYQADIAKSKGYNALRTPIAGVKSSPLTKGVSEDPFVNQKLISAFESGMAQKNMIACVTCDIEKTNIANMDKKPSERVLNDYFFGSFGGTKSCAFQYPFTQYEGAYSQVNTKDLNDYLHAQADGRNGTVFCFDCPPEASVRAIAKGNVLISSSSNGVRSAIQKFDDLYGKVQNGEIDAAVLEEALANGSAMSISQLDEAVDRALYVCSLTSKASSGASAVVDGQLAIEATEQSIVLLKNGGFLPISSRVKKLAIVGSEEQKSFMSKMEDGFLQRRCSVSTLVGYKANGRLDETLEESCLDQIVGFDAVIILLKGSDEIRYNLPANQLAMIDRLRKKGIPIIAVLCGDKVVDVGFDGKVTSLLLCPSITSSSPTALVNVLTGATNPSGKLINTFYTGTEEYYKNVTDLRRSGSTKVGNFLGYRYYDSANLKVKYPFGYGQSYTQFEYSLVSVEGDKVTFSIKNVGETDGAEVVQIYVGKANSDLVRPKKELKVYERVELLRGQKKTLSVQIPSESLAVYGKGQSVVENGDWQVYIGSSVRDIRLKANIFVYGKKLKKSNEKLNDYVPYSSNVVSEGYTMTAVRKKVNAGKKNKIAGGVLMGISLGLEIIAVILYLMQALSSEITDILFIVMCAGIPALFVLGLILLIVGCACASRARKKAPIVSTGNAPNQRAVRRQEYKNLFESLYSADEETKTKKEEASTVTAIVNEEFVGEYRPFITFDTTCESLTKLLNESGVFADKGIARKILASMSASRFIVMPSTSTTATTKLLSALATFCNGKVYEQSVDGYDSPSQLISNVEGKETPLTQAINACGENRDSINFVYIKTKNIDATSKLVSPFLRCADRRSSSEVFIYQDGKTNKITVYPNLWFVLVAEDGCSYLCDNTVFGDNACLLSIDISLTDEKSDKTAFTPFNFYQLQKMEQKLLGIDATDEFALDEEKYLKKFDRLEAYLNKQSEYLFGNKLNMSLERYLTVFLACNGEQENAFDCAVASKIMLTALGMVNDNLTGEGGFMEHLDVTFGEDPAEETKKIIAICSATNV